MKGKLHLKEFLGITVELIKTLVSEGREEWEESTNVSILILQPALLWGSF